MCRCYVRIEVDVQHERVVIAEREPSRRHAREPTGRAANQQMIDAQKADQGCPGVAPGVREAARQPAEGLDVARVGGAGRP